MDLYQAQATERLKGVIGRNKNAAFSIYMVDHVASAWGFDVVYEFPATKYFPRVAFGPVYLSGKKTRVFNDRIEILGYKRNEGGLRSSLKHRQQIRDWPRPKCRAELDAFLWLTIFLRIFIPGRAAHVLTLKEAYLEQVPANTRPKKIHDGDVEDSDQDYTKNQVFGD